MERNGEFKRQCDMDICKYYMQRNGEIISKTDVESRANIHVFHSHFSG